MRRVGSAVLIAMAIVLSQAGVAQAHRLSIADADRAITRAIKAVAEGAGYDRAWADRCSRISGHKVGCTAFTKDWVSSMGALAKCRRDAEAAYRKPGSTKISVWLSGTVKCTYTYPQPPAACDDGADNDGDGKTDYPADPDCTSPDDDNEAAPLPAPDTQITEGPANGSTVQGTRFPDGTVLAFVDIDVAAVGGVDPFFECGEDGGAFNFCGVGQTWSTSLVYESEGPHSLQVRACSGWGSQEPVCDATPETRSFTVVASS